MVKMPHSDITLELPAFGVSGLISGALTSTSGCRKEGEAPGCCLSMSAPPSPLTTLPLESKERLGVSRVWRPTSASSVDWTSLTRECRTTICHETFQWIKNMGSGKNVLGKEYGDGVINPASCLLLPSTVSLTVCWTQCSIYSGSTSPGRRPLSQDTITRYLHVWETGTCCQGWEEHLKMAKGKGQHVSGLSAKEFL